MERHRRRRTTGRKRRGVSVAGVAALACAATALPAQADMTIDQCLSRSSKNTTTTTKATLEEFRQHRAPDSHTFDLRRSRILGNLDRNSSSFDPKPVTIGSRTEPSGLCLVGGYVEGTQSRSLDWMYLKKKPGGGDKAPVYLATSGSATVNGLRIENMMNGLRPKKDGVTLRNAYYEYIRDDCFEGDDLTTMLIEDSLFDGCYTGISRQPGDNSPLYDQGKDRSVLTLDRVLVRMQRMPGGYKKSPSMNTWGRVFKVASIAGPIVVRDSIFYTPPAGKKGTEGFDWPPQVTAKNVTVVWTGSGAYPGDLPAGVTVTKDKSVWTSARAKWLKRHGCSSIASCNTDKLVDPA